MNIEILFNMITKVRNFKSNKFYTLRYAKRNTPTETIPELENFIRSNYTKLGVMRSSMVVSKYCGFPEPACKININRHSGSRTITIFMPTSLEFANKYAYYITILHELAHAVRAKYKNIEDLIEESKSLEILAKEELIAETTALLLLEQYSVLNKKMLYSSLLYLRYWSHTLSEVSDRKFNYDYFNDSILSEVLYRIKILTT